MGNMTKNEKRLLNVIESSRLFTETFQLSQILSGFDFRNRFQTFWGSGSFLGLDENNEAFLN